MDDKLVIMEKIIALKFKAGSDLANKLKNTNDSDLFENSPYDRPIGVP